MIKITSDGTPENTHIIDEKTGNSIRGVSEIQWGIRGGAEVIQEITLKFCAFSLSISFDKKQATWVLDDEAIEEVSSWPRSVREQIVKQILELEEK